jgi:hypothetical protein
MCILITAAIWMPQLKRKPVRRMSHRKGGSWSTIEGRFDRCFVALLMFSVPR